MTNRARAAGTATSRTRDRRPRGRYTGQAIVLTVVLIALGLSYVFPLRVYLDQRAEIGQLRESQAAQQEYVAQLADEAALWADDDYLRIQARKRLYFGEPGELLLVISEPREPPETGFDPDAVPPPPGTWWGTLWASVRSADAAPADAAPADADAGGGSAEPAGAQSAGAETGR